MSVSTLQERNRYSANPSSFSSNQSITLFMSRLRSNKPDKYPTNQANYNVNPIKPIIDSEKRYS